jgi:hypothetical protein
MDGTSASPQRLNALFGALIEWSATGPEVRQLHPVHAAQVRNRSPSVIILTKSTDTLGRGLGRR